MIADFEEINSFASGCLEKAKEAARSIPFVINARHATAKGFELSEDPAFIANEPEYAELETAYGMAAWSVILSVDLRDSSKRAITIGPRHTYLTMHTYLPTMGELVRKSKGKIVGLRGDGLFAAFGLTKQNSDYNAVTTDITENAARNAVRCGKAMVEAISEIICPLLELNGIKGNLEIGVGISVGDVIVTRIGLRDATEVTVYGPPVNQACKMCNRVTGVGVTTGVNDIYPTSANGQLRFERYSEGFKLQFPPQFKMLVSEAHTRKPKAK